MTSVDLDRVEQGAFGREDPVDLHQAVARSLLSGAGLDDELFERAVDVIGAAALMETITVVGYYRLLADLLHAFDIQAPGSTPVASPARASAVMRFPAEGQSTVVPSSRGRDPAQPAAC